jgi:hypothetical protein
MSAIKLEVIALNMQQNSEIELMKLAFRVVEHIIIVTQANYTESQVVEFTKLLDHSNLLADGIVEKPYTEEEKEKRALITLEDRMQILNQVNEFV